MNRKDITRLCSQAMYETKGVDSPLFRFAALVAAAEREACAVLIENLRGENPDLWQVYVAAEIRARGTHE